MVNYVKEFLVKPESGGDKIKVSIQAEVDSEGKNIAEELNKANESYQLVNTGDVQAILNEDDETVELKLKSGIIPTIPTKVSELTNDANYATISQLPTIPQNISVFTNDSKYQTEDQVNTKLNNYETKTKHDTDLNTKLDKPAYDTWQEGVVKGLNKNGEWEEFDPGISEVYTDNDTILGNGSSEAEALHINPEIITKLDTAAGKAEQAIIALAHLGTAITIKGSKTEETLPTDPTNGDAYIITASGEQFAEGTLVVWDGNEWIGLSTMPDLSNYAQKDEIPILKPGANITITKDNNEYTINSSGGGSGTDKSYVVTEDTGEDHIKVTKEETDTITTFKLSTQNIPTCIAATTLPSDLVEGGFYFIYE